MAANKLSSLFAPNCCSITQVAGDCAYLPSLLGLPFTKAVHFTTSVCQVCGRLFITWWLWDQHFTGKSGDVTSRLKHQCWSWTRKTLNESRPLSLHTVLRNSMPQDWSQEAKCLIMTSS